MFPSIAQIFQFIFLTIVAVMITVQTSFLLKTKFHVSDEDAFSKCDLSRSGEIPHHVTIMFKKEYVCSGTLIHKKYVITLAECVVESVQENSYKTKLKVVVATRTLPGGTLCDVEKITYPPSYDKKTGTDNIALIRLEEKVPLDDDVYPISLPDKKIKIEEGLELFVSGFDMRSGYGKCDLHKFSMHVVSNERCRKFYESGSHWNLSGKFCAIAALGYQPCLSDPGSPAAHVKPKYVIGIRMVRKGCPRKEPELFINVTSYLEFIESSM